MVLYSLRSPHSNGSHCSYLFRLKMPWKWRVKFVYYFVKVHGLAHYSYDQKQHKVTQSIWSVVYGLLWTVSYTVVLMLLLYSINTSRVSYQNHMIYYIVNCLEIVFILVKAVLYYVEHIIQSKELTLLINDGFYIDELLSAVYQEQRQNHRKFERLYRFQKRLFLLQSFLIFGSFFIYVHLKMNESVTGEILFAFITVYAHFSTIIVSNLYFFGSLLLAYDSYYCMNSKLKEIFAKVDDGHSHIEMGSFDQACEDIDRLSWAYSCVSVYMTRINRVSSVQISGELIGGFLMILCAVSSMRFYAIYRLLRGMRTNHSSGSQNRNRLLFSVT